MALFRDPVQFYIDEAREAEEQARIAEKMDRPEVAAKFRAQAEESRRMEQIYREARKG